MVPTTNVLKVSVILENSKAKYLIIAAIAIASCCLLYLFGIFFIQTIMLVGYAACFPAILIYEKRRRNGMSSEMTEFSGDERWSETKSKLKKVEDRIRNSSNPDEKQVLLAQKRTLETELRGLEWKIKESEMTKAYNASKENTRDLSWIPAKPAQSDNNQVEEREKYSNRKHLLKIVREAQSIMQNEPFASFKIALIPLANDLKTHYKILKEKSEKNNFERSILSDYWASWMVLSCLINGVSIDYELPKYTSDEYRPRFKKLIESAEQAKALHLEEFAASKDLLNDSEYSERADVDKSELSNLDV